VAAQSISSFGAARGFFRAFWRAARQVFHETTGTLFFALAVAAVCSAWRGRHNGSASWLLWVTAGYALLMVFFGVMSFRDARRVR